MIIFDATLFVNAYETQLFRTGLYRVSEQLLLQLLDSYSAEQIYLYDTQGRNRLMRQVVLPPYAGVQLLDTDSRWFAWLTDTALRTADDCRRREHAAEQTWCAKGWKLLKNILRVYGSICRRIMPPRQIALPGPIAQLRYIATYYPIPQWVHQCGIRATLIVHDLIPLIHPEWFPNDANKKTLQAIIDSATLKDRVVCVSYATLADFLRFRSDFPETQVSVAHLAGAECFRPTPLDKDLQNKFGIKGNDYLLSVCTLEPRKNLSLVVDAYELLLQQVDGKVLPKLLLVGAMGWKTSALLDKIQQLNRKYSGSIVITGYLSDNDLAQLYTNALAFIYVSLYEGFGLPPLEAMSCGCPVITSNVSSLPEVVGDVGWTIDPTNVIELVRTIKQVQCSDWILMREQALKRAQHFSWKRFASKIIETLNK